MIRWLAFALAALLSATPASAQRWPDEQCVENPNIASCAQSLVDSLAPTYGVRRIEEHRDAGDEVLRVFFIKDGGRAALVSLVRAPGRDPTIYVHFPRPRTGPAPAPMQAPATQALWDEAFSRAAYADRSLVPLPRDPQVICLHPWTFVFEASVPAEPHYGRPARGRRHIANSCDDAPLLYFADDLQRLVSPLFPACDALDASRFGNAITRFVTCQRLSGDRLAAAEAMNLSVAFTEMRGSGYADTLGGLFEPQAVIDWNGRRRVLPDGSPAAFWQARIAENEVNGFYVETAEGQSGDRVRLRGHLSRNRPGTNDGTRLTARFEQIWTRFGSAIRVASVTVGPWENGED